MKKRFLFAVASFCLYLTGMAQSGFPFYQPFNGTTPASVSTVGIAGNSAAFTTDGVMLTNANGATGAIKVDQVFSELSRGIQLEFEYAMTQVSTWTSGGLSAFFYDGSIDLTEVGHPEYGLGYCYLRNHYHDQQAQNKKGIQGAYLGLGLALWKYPYTRMGGQDTDNLGAGTAFNNIIHSGVVWNPSISATTNATCPVDENQIYLRGAAGTGTVPGNVFPAATGYFGYPLLATSGVATSGNKDASFYGHMAVLKSATEITKENPYTLGSKIANGNFNLETTGGNVIPQTPNDPNYRKMTLTLVPHNGVDGTEGYDVTVKAKYGTEETVVINNFHYQNTTKYCENANSTNATASIEDQYSSLVTIPTAMPNTLRIGFAAFSRNAGEIKNIRELYVSRPTAAVAKDKTVINRNPNEVTFAFPAGTGAFDGTNHKTAYTNGLQSSNIDLSKVEFYAAKTGGSAITMPHETTHGTWSFNTTNGAVTFTPKTDAAGEGTDIIYYSVISKGTTLATLRDPEYRSNRAMIKVDNDYRKVTFFATDNTTPVSTVYTKGLNTTLAAGTQTLPSNQTKTGYTFVGWNTAQNATASNFITTTTVNSDINIYPAFTANTYTISLNQEGGIGGSTSVEATYDAAMPAATMPTRTGYSFGGYYTATNGGGTQYYNAGGTSAKNCDFTANATLYAKWTANQYDITLDQEEGIGGSTSVKATYGAAMPAATMPTRTGYSFGGYYTATNGGGMQYYNADGTSAKNCDFTANTTLHAKWTAQTYNITLDKKDGTGGDGSVTVTYGAAMPTAVMPTKTGYTFGGYFDAVDGAGKQYYTNVGASANAWDKDGATTLFAKWTAKTYTVTFLKADNVTTLDTKTATFGSLIGTLPTAETKIGYSFTNWNTQADGNGVAYDATTTYNVDGDLTLFAFYEIKTNKLTLDGTDAGHMEFTGTYTATTDMIPFGTALTITANPKTGYTFAQWWKDGALDATTTAVWTGNMPDNNMALKPTYTANSYTITFNGNGSTTGATPAQTIKYTEKANLNANVFTRTGYTFAGWSETADGNKAYNDQAEYTMGTVGNKDLFAKWTPNTYMVVFDKNEAQAAGTTVSGTMADQTFTYDAAQNLTANAFAAAEGYTFGGWNKSAGGTGTAYTNEENVNNLTTANNENVRLFAQWTPIQHSVTYDANYKFPNGNAGTVPAVATNYDYNREVTVLGNTGGLAETGCTFNGWNTAADGTGTSYAANAKFTMPNTDITLYAQWTVNQYSVVFTKTDLATTDEIITKNYKDEIGKIPYLNADGTWDVDNAPQKQGYTFIGWNTAQNQAVSNFEDPTWEMEATTTTVYPAFVVHTFDLILDTTDPGLKELTGTHIVTTTDVAYGTTIEITASTVDATYSFKEWQKDGNTFTSNATIKTTMPDADLTLKPVFNKLYNVKVEEPMVHGNAVANKTTNLLAGTTVTLTLTPENGYAVDKITITRDDNNATVTSTRVDLTTATFPMPTSDATVSVTFGIDDNNNGIVDDNECTLDKEYVTKKFDDVVVCDNSSNLFTAYQWYKNGKPISGATKQFYSDPKGLVGRYAVEVKMKDGTSKFSCAQDYNSPLIDGTFITVYPNPTIANEKILVEIHNVLDEELENAMMTIYSVSGSKVKTMTNVKRENSFTLAPGEYAGKLILSSGKEFSYKVMVQK